MAARFVHAGGDLLRRRLEAAGVEVPEDGHDGRCGAAGDQAIELEPGPLANSGGVGREAKWSRKKAFLEARMQRWTPTAPPLFAAASAISV